METDSCLPALHAQCSALLPSWSTTFTPAPRRSKSSTACKLPCSADVCSAVHPPTNERCSNATPASSSKHSRPGAVGCAHASSSAVERPLRTGSVVSAPSLSSSSTERTSGSSLFAAAAAHAAESGVCPFPSLSSMNESAPAHRVRSSSISSSDGAVTARWSRECSRTACSRAMSSVCRSAADSRVLSAARTAATSWPVPPRDRPHVTPYGPPSCASIRCLRAAADATTSACRLRAPGGKAAF
mmetsp:Transcript_44385/g.110428  ORF Transcript_44385/g.110428 Transcript_44385/m.110428 type:complete len:243 (+) Transcript_44385:46-774(+)